MTANNAGITVRVQAKGGKFLADDIGGAEISIRNNFTGELLASGITRGDSGNLQPAYSHLASQRPIITPATMETPQKIQWVSVDPPVGPTPPKPITSCFTAELSLERPTLLEIAAFGPLGGLQTSQRVSATQWILPGQYIVDGPGFVLEMPGLLCQVMQPATHMHVNKVNDFVPIMANVAMMCGCPIQPGQPWIPEDFEVYAHIRLVGGAEVSTIRMDFASPNTAGIFTGSYKVLATGFYELTVSAVQNSTGNRGAGVVTFFIPPAGS